MKTSAAWWEETKSSDSAFEGWLHDQYRGESTAAARIELLRDAFAPPGSRAHRVLTVIAAQEKRHASWIGELLTARDRSLDAAKKTERYWPEVTSGITDLETGAAVGAHAERMRLERIEVIAADTTAPVDVRHVFTKILREERFHERAFRQLAGDAALLRAASAHALGREALGLVP
jgi:rubrerythrin